MARTTKQLSGGGKDKFLRGIVAEAGLADVAAARMVDALTSSITEIRVRRDIWEDISKAEPSKGAQEDVPTIVVPTPPAVVEAAATSFDPFAFSAVALLSKKGKAALAAELDKIGAAAHLHKLAAAQHLAVDPSLQDVAALRAAVIAGAERRIAERRAAAS
jgi:hypothetical protein